VHEFPSARRPLLRFVMRRGGVERDGSAKGRDGRERVEGVGPQGKGKEGSTWTFVQGPSSS